MLKRARAWPNSGSLLSREYGWLKGNNQICDPEELENLRQLPKLIITDLSGTPHSGALSDLKV